MNPLFATPHTFSNEVYIEEAPSKVTHCRACDKQFSLGEMRVTLKRSYSKSHYFHLECFEPVTKVRIQHEDVQTKIKSPQYRERIEDWIQAWNRQFVVADASLGIYTEKRVDTKPPNNRRVLIESFKFLDAKTVAAAAGPTCKSWYHTAWEPEVWILLAQSSFPRSKTEYISRKEFITGWFHMCTHCSKPLAESEIHMICPMSHKPKCVQCYYTRENRPQRLSWLKSEFKINPGRVKRLGVATFQFDGHDCTYLGLADEVIAKQRKAVCEAIVASRKCEGLWGKRLEEVIRGGNVRDFGLFEWGKKKKMFEYVGNLYDFISSAPKVEEVEKFLG